MSADMIILGKNTEFTTDTTVSGLYNNVLVVGPSGCGKTTSITEPRLLETHNDSLIVPVTKRRLIDEYRGMFEKRGYIVEELNFVEPYRCTVGFNPVRFAKSDLEIASLARAIVYTDPNKKFSKIDPYWDNAGAALLTAEIAMARYKKGDRATFTDVLDFHNRVSMGDSGDLFTTTVDRDFERMKSEDPNSMAISCWNTYRNASAKTAGNIYSTLNACLNGLFIGEIRTLMTMDIRQVDFTRLASEKTVLFIVTSPMNPTLDSFINIFYSTAFRALFEFAESRHNGRLPIPVQVICDDFATGCKIDDFAQKISVFGAKGISVMLLCQSESQLAGLYGESDATTIINNCDTYVYMGGMDLATCRSISARMNLPLEDILYMPVGQEYIFRRGTHPVVTTRYDKKENIHSPETLSRRKADPVPQRRRRETISLLSKGGIKAV